MKTNLAGRLRRDVARSMSALAIVATAGLAGCASIPNASVQQIRAGYDAYLARDFRSADAQLTPVIEQYPASPEVAEALYVRSLCRLSRGERSNAKTDLEQALPLSQRPLLRALVQTQLANLAFDDGQYARAARLYEGAVPDLVPREPPVDRVLYQYGLSVEREGRFADAKPVFAEVIADFPASAYAPPARRHFKWAHDYFTVQCGAYSKVATAHETAAQLKGSGFEALAIPTIRDGTKLFVIHTGKYRSYAAAAAAADRIRAIVPDAFVMP